MAKKMVDVEMPTKVQKTTKRSRAAIFVLIALLGFSLFASGYYLIDSLVIENSYKVYVGGTNQNGVVGKGLSLSYDKDFANGGYKDLSGRGLKLEDQSNTGTGMSFGSSTVTSVDNSGMSYSVMDYLTSVASSAPNTVDTNVADKGKEGEANSDQFVTSKFYLRNESKKDASLMLDGEVDYKIGIEITKNSKNAVSALRLAIIEVYDEERVYNTSTGLYDNNYFNMEVFAQPIKVIEEDDKVAYSNESEYVATTETGVYTNGYNSLGLQAYGLEGQPSTPLVKNPNKDHTSEDWKCTNLKYDLTSIRWTYDSVKDAEKVYHLDYNEERAYVVAAWFEASDPDHNNEISHGYISFTVTFTVVEKETN